MQSLEIKHKLIESLPVFKFKDWTLYGFCIGLDTIKSLDELEGSWFAWKRKVSGEVCLRADASASIRCYVTNVENKILISDDLDSLAIRVNSDINKTTKIHFENTGYLFGHRTIYETIYKIPPLTTLCFREEEVFIKDHFYDLNKLTFDFAAFETLFSKLPINNLKVLLMYSGGSDSHALAMLLKSKGIPYEAVFLDDGNRNGDRKRALKQAAKSGIKLCVLPINEDGTIENDIAEIMTYDKHYSKLHFYGMREVARLYGTELIIINGQGADTLFALGPSEMSIQSFLKRVAIHFDGLLYRIATLVLSVFYKKKMLLKKSNKADLYASFSVFKNYLFSKVDVEMEAWKQFFKDDRFLHSSKWKQLLSIKRFGFLGGSDNQVVVKSCHYSGIYRVFLPFSSSIAMRIALGIEDTSRITRITRPKQEIRRYAKIR
ncbi:MAG: hypothetical protein ACON5K_11970 [Bacteroidia bacterium]